MGAEFLETGELHVYRRHDAEELKRIKRGAWLLEQVKAEAERLFSVMEASRQRSPLPPAPDAEAANRLLMQLHSDVLGLSYPQT